jgi:hypothetical protein
LNFKNPKNIILVVLTCILSFVILNSYVHALSNFHLDVESEYVPDISEEVPEGWFERDENVIITVFGLFFLVFLVGIFKNWWY